MKTGAIDFSDAFFCFMAAVVLLISLPGLSYAKALQPQQHVWIELFPSENRLEGKTDIQMPSKGKKQSAFFLSEHAQIKSVKIDGIESAYEFSNGMLVLHPDNFSGGKKNIKIHYEAVFNDPAPVLPANFDNPGFGVAGTISEKGVFLLNGSGWHPQSAVDKISPFRLSVKAPRGMIAVTAGKFLGYKTDGLFTTSQWRVENMVEGLSLSAGQYEVLKESAGDVDVMTFFFPETSELAPAYLSATKRNIEIYESLFGEYPFEKFAVVENFFPTGYGFASYTLLGTRVLRLPFIIDTSLVHEIAHCWWGNGVIPDYSQGNWSEGLTTYAADYLLKEKRSRREAREYRLQWLRNYAALIDRSNDFPLEAFRSRVDPATKVIGYDKSAMVFHMLRKKTGDDVFWQGLRQVYRDRLFKKTSWDHFREVYETLTGESLDGFFDQWIHRKGGPVLAMENVSNRNSGSSTKISGMLVQNPPYYDLEVDIFLDTEKSSLKKTVMISGGSASFGFETNESPATISVDPDVDIFRKLYSEEIPPTINSLKSSDSMVVAIAGRDIPKLKPVADLLMESLGVDNYRIVDGEKVAGKKLQGSDILWVGAPPHPEQIYSPSNHAILGSDRFNIGGVSYDKQGDCFFGVFQKPGSAGRVIGVYLPLSAKKLASVARKVTHYGKYSYLVFRDGKNILKGTWPVNDSPLIHRFDKENQIQTNG